MAAMSQQEAKLFRCRTTKWLNVGPFGRSTAEAPQGDGVDGEGQPKLSSKVRYDEGYRQPSKNMAAASDTQFEPYAGKPVKERIVWISAQPPVT